MMTTLIQKLGSLFLAQHPRPLKAGSIGSNLLRCWKPRQGQNIGSKFRYPGFSESRRDEMWAFCPYGYPNRVPTGLGAVLGWLFSTQITPLAGLLQLEPIAPALEGSTTYGLVSILPFFQRIKTSSLPKIYSPLGVGGFLLIALLFSNSTQAQPLDSLVQLALRQNPGLQSRYTRYQSQLERVPQESQLADPRLDFSTQLLPLRNRTWEQAAIIGGMQEFPWPGTLATRSAIAISESRVVYAQAEAEALELAYEVRMSWLEYYQVVNSIKILAEGLRLSSSAERLALARLESGRGNAAEVLKIQLKIRQQEQELNLLKNRLKFPQLRLNQLLNRPADAPIQVQETLQFEYLPLRMDSLLAQIKRDHPALNGLRYEKEVSRQNEALNRLEGKPELGIGLDYVVMSKVTEHGLTSDGKDMLMPRFGLRLPLYRKKYEAKAREEQLRREGLDLEAQALGNDFTATIGQALAIQEEARLTQEFVQEQLKTLDALIKMQEGNFSTDAVVYENLLENYQMRLEYQLMELEAIVKTQQAKVQVQKLLKP